MKGAQFEICIFQEPTKWTFLPGAISWKPGGIQYAPIQSVSGMYEATIGRAALFEREAAFFMALRFDVDDPALAVWVNQLPGEPQAAKAAMKPLIETNAFDKRGRQVVHLDVFSVRVDVGNARESLTARKARKVRPVGGTELNDHMDAIERLEDWGWQ
ncbi:hypothetical protein [Devosia sp.]|uniref:hypothetical protein n=1 Tax=Devosia sp. TaxID=1871048 RepID=UPI001AD27B06|nr:hypothetical protein [Devosia sp.]MBN9334962.1 hypothetical protein [Devosia sp.]